MTARRDPASGGGGGGGGGGSGGHTLLGLSAAPSDVREWPPLSADTERRVTRRVMHAGYHRLGGFDSSDCRRLDSAPTGSSDV